MLAPGVRILAALLVATAAGACAAAQPPAAPSPTTAPASIASGGGAPAARDPLRVVYVTLNGAMGPLWVAHEAGIFANNGIDAEMIYISSGTLGMQALLAKEVDIGVIAASAAIAANLNGADTVYIGAIQRTFGLWIYANPDVEAPA